MRFNGTSIFLSTVSFIALVSTLNSVCAQETTTGSQSGSIYEINNIVYSLGLNDKSDITERIGMSISQIDFMGNFQTDSNSFVKYVPNSAFVVFEKYEKFRKGDNILQYLRFDKNELPGNLGDGLERDNIFNNNPQFGQNNEKFRINNDNNIQFDKNNNDDTIISQFQRDRNQEIIDSGDNTQIQRDKNQVIIGSGNDIQNINQADYNKWQTNIDVDYTNKENNNEINQVEVKNDKCPTQTQTIQLNDKISPFGVIILAGYEPCKVNDGSVTLNLPNNPNLAFTVIHFDDNSDDQKGAMVDLDKVHDIGSKNILYKIELDASMTGIEPVTNNKVTIQQINTLALFNNGKEPIEFNSDNSVAITSILDK